jgi:hypothetical protein
MKVIFVFGWQTLFAVGFSVDEKLGTFILLKFILRDVWNKGDVKYRWYIFKGVYLVRSRSVYPFIATNQMHNMTYT